MKKVVYFLSFCFLIMSCNFKKQPVFIKVDNIEVISFEADTIKLKANAFFENPNDVGGKIITKNLKVLVNEIEVAQVFSENFNVPARNLFTIPLTAHIPTKNILNNTKNGGLGSLINSLISSKVNVRIKGNLEYKIFGFKREYLVDETEEIRIRL